MRLPIHREGWPFIAIAVAINAGLFWLAAWAGFAFLPITIWVGAFFRDPERVAPEGEHLVLSPADGVLLPIIDAAPPPELGLGEIPRPRMSIFMNVFNVHVNRNPMNGTVTKLAYRPGKFVNASFDKASELNERMAMTVALEGSGPMAGKNLVVVQIAGLVARRIKCDLKEGQKIARNQRFGMIRFGSRLDVYLPEGARVVARAGQTMVAGETILADFPISG